MKTYELTYIISPEITSEEAGAKAKEIESAVQNKEGTILKQLNPVAKTLAYPISKRASGFFVVLEFQLESEKLEELAEIIKKDGKIVRNMLIIKEAAKPKKERRIKVKSAAIFEVEQKTGNNEIPKPAAAKAEGKGKVELKDIEQKLNELLSE